MLGVTAAKPLRQEDFYQLPDQLYFAVAEELFHCRIGRRDTAVRGGYDNRIRRSEKKFLEQRLRMF